ncbi:hypothetical protein P8452_77159 [Trifolium repens]|nr:hypothetical protein P8452_77159 [Trifolium repens]
MPMLERPDQSTTTDQKARPNHLLATHRPSFLDAESLTLLCSTRRLDSISGSLKILAPPLRRRHLLNRSAVESPLPNCVAGIWNSGG